MWKWIVAVPRIVPEAAQNGRLGATVTERRDATDLDGGARVLDFVHCGWLPSEIGIGVVTLQRGEHFRRLVFRSSARKAFAVSIERSWRIHGVARIWMAHW